MSRLDLEPIPVPSNNTGRAELVRIMDKRLNELGTRFCEGLILSVLLSASAHSMLQMSVADYVRLRASAPHGHPETEQEAERRPDAWRNVVNLVSEMTRSGDELNIRTN